MPDPCREGSAPAPHRNSRAGMAVRRCREGGLRQTRNERFGRFD